MEFRRIWTLRGPNYWANFPVLEALVDLGELKDRSSELIPGFNERLKTWLPSLIEHRCSVGERGGFFQRLERGTYMAHTLEHVALELQTLAGSDTGFGRVRELDEDGVYKLALKFEEEALGRACLETGRQLILAAIENSPFDVAAETQRLRELSYDVRLGPSTRAIVRAARTRGIPFRRLNAESLVQLGHGAKARRICTAETDRTSAIAETIAQDKQLTRMLLRSVGCPVPEGRPVSDAEDAWRTAQELGLPIVVKPQYGNHGRGVQTNLSTREQVEKAYAAAREESRHIMVEQFIEGVDHRLLVIGYQLVAVAVRHPAHVIGDGRSTIKQLVEQVNRDPRRSDGHSTSLSFIKLDTIGLEVLAEQGFTPDSIAPAGQTVLIRRNANLSTGGTATDVTARVHPDVAARAVEAARVIGLDIAGVDVVARDISLSLEEQRGAMVEVNAGPGLRMHIEPTEGQPQPVGEAIVNLLFPPGENGRIPIVGIGGTTGRAVTAKLVAHILATTGKTVGLASGDGLFVGARQQQTSDCANATSAQSLLLNPLVNAAVLEVTADGLLCEGFGCDRCDVGIVTNLGPAEQLDLHGLETLDKFVRLQRTVVDAVLPTGTAVLNADDPLVASMAEKPRGRVVFFSPTDQNAAVADHRTRGGRAVFVRDNFITLVDGDTEECLLPLAEVASQSTDGQRPSLETILAAVAAGWSMAVPLTTLRQALASFAI